MTPDQIKRKVAGDPFRHYFGACPECGGIGDIIHVHRDQFVVCHDCRLYQHIGSNLFSGWRELPEEVFAQNQTLLALCSEREFVSPTADDLDAARAYERIMRQDNPKPDTCPF